MGPLIGLVVVVLVAFAALAAWRGRLVSVALAAAECPECRVPLVPLSASGPSGDAAGVRSVGPVLAGRAPSETSGAPGLEGGRSNWEVCVCPRCDRVVTTVDRLPSPVSDCPSCLQRSLVVYAERTDGVVIVDEWCDMCGRRGRVTLADPSRLGPEHHPPEREGRVLPFRRR